jgi:hypothetical protein
MTPIVMGMFLVLKNVKNHQRMLIMSSEQKEVVQIDRTPSAEKQSASVTAATRLWPKAFCQGIS